MDKDSEVIFKVLTEAQDKLALQVGALVAVVGAMTEKQAPEMARVDAWCRAIAGHSDREHGLSQNALQRVARDLLKGIDGAEAN